MDSSDDGPSGADQKKPNSFPFIQPWFVVLGDTHARADRTTVATNLLRKIKEDYKEKFAGHHKSTWIPKAIRDFNTRLAAAFPTDEYPNIDKADMGRVLVKCTPKAKKTKTQRILVENVYGYEGDEKPTYGTAKPQESLRFFLSSRDPPKLDKELEKYERHIHNLTDNPSRGPPGALLREFMTTIAFFREKLDSANQGNVMAAKFLEKLAPINTLADQWKLLQSYMNDREDNYEDDEDLLDRVTGEQRENHDDSEDDDPMGEIDPMTTDSEVLPQVPQPQNEDTRARAGIPQVPQQHQQQQEEEADETLARANKKRKCNDKEDSSRSHASLDLLIEVLVGGEANGSEKKEYIDEGEKMRPDESVAANKGTNESNCVNPPGESLDDKSGKNVASIRTCISEGEADKSWLDSFVSDCNACLAYNCENSDKVYARKPHEWNLRAYQRLYNESPEKYMRDAPKSDLGWLYYEGLIGDGGPDYERAAECFRQVPNDACAQYRIGLLYFKGLIGGNGPDFTLATKYYQAAEGIEGTKLAILGRRWHAAEMTYNRTDRLLGPPSPPSSRQTPTGASQKTMPTKIVH
eukprot:scaffold4522_cov130-Amphora_coffeaeformis.AAC.3